MTAACVRPGSLPGSRSGGGISSGPGPRFGGRRAELGHRGEAVHLLGQPSLCEEVVLADASNRTPETVAQDVPDMTVAGGRTGGRIGSRPGSRISSRTNEETA